MPFENQSSGFAYTNFFKGRFTIKASDGDTDESIVERVNKNNVKVREYQYESLSQVTLADIREATHEEYGKSWEFIFLDGNRYVLLRLSKKSRIATMILNKLENIDIKEPFSIRGYYFEKDDRSAINIYQDGKKLANVYTKENPGALPPPVKTTINEETVWDWTEQLTYWSKLVLSLKPHMLGVNVEAAQVAQEQEREQPKVTAPVETAKKTEAPPMTSEEEEDDLPF